MIDQTGYRRNVGIILMNHERQVLWARRIHQQSAWQFPQGGVDEGEAVEQALFRELKEELGLEKVDVKILAQTQDWFFYAIPEKYQRRSAKHTCRGQYQKWFLLQLIVNESKIRLDDCETPEFDEWRWVDYWYPLDHVIAFKHDVYQKVLAEFATIAGRGTS